MPNLAKAQRREKKRDKTRKMVVDGKALLDPIDWEARLKKAQKKRKK